MRGWRGIDSTASALLRLAKRRPRLNPSKGRPAAFVRHTRSAQPGSATEGASLVDFSRSGNDYDHGRDPGLLGVRGPALPHRQPRQRLRAHSSVCRSAYTPPAEPVQGFHGSGISLQPVRRAGARDRRRDPGVRHVEVRRRVSALLEGRGQRRRCLRSLQVLEVAEGGRRGKGRHLVELRQVPRRWRGQCACALRAEGDAGRDREGSSRPPLRSRSHG